MNIAEADRFEISKKILKGKVKYEVSMGSRGCGCCEKEYCEYYSVDEARAMLKQWIKKKGTELAQLKQILTDMVKGIKEDSS